MQDFRVKTFLTVCRTLNYTRAAEELALTQPAVSQHITYLEREYGAKLFTYHRKKLELTPAGRVLRDGLATMAPRRAIARTHRGGGPWRHSQAAHRHDADRRRVRGGPAPRPLSGAPDPTFRVTRAIGRNPAPDGAPRRGNHRLPAPRTPRTLEVEGLFDKARYASRPFSSERLVPICAAEHRFSGARTPRTLGRSSGRTTHSARGGILACGSRNVLVQQRSLSGHQRELRACPELGNG